MGQFIGIVNGRGGETSRQGTKDSGLSVKANAWDIGCQVELFHLDKEGEDRMNVYLTFGSNDVPQDGYKVGSFTRMHIAELKRGDARLQFVRNLPSVTMGLDGDEYSHEGEET